MTPVLNLATSDIDSTHYCRLTNWQERTPVVCRYMAYITLPVSLISALAGGSFYTTNIPLLTLGRGELWRLFTSMIDQGGFFTVLFVGLVLVLQAPAHEFRVGSTFFLYNTFLHALLINVGYAVIGLLLGLIPDMFFRAFAFMPAQGLWGVIMGQITVQMLADPTGTTRFLCCPPIQNRYYPWFLVCLFSLISLFPQIDLLLGVILGHLQSYGYLDRLKPSDRKLQEWELTGWAARLRMPRAPGFVYAPTTTLPVGQRDVAREAMAETWGAMSAQMFGRRNNSGVTDQPPGSRTGAGQAGAGSGEGSSSAYLYRPGRGAAAAGGAGSGGGSTTATTQDSTHFPGSGRTLADSGAPSGGAGAAPSAPSNLVGSLFGVGRAGSSASQAPPVHASAAPSTADVEARRRAAAAAAEARLRSVQGRGLQEGSPRSPGGVTASSAVAASSGTADLLGFAQGSKTASTAAPARGGYARAYAQGSGAGGVDTRALDSQYGAAAGSGEGEGEEDGENVPLVKAAGASQYPDEDVDLRGVMDVRTSTSNPAYRQFSPPSATTGLASLAASGVCTAAEAQRRVQSLVEMGFARAEAEAALVACKGDVEAAVERLSTI